MFFKPSKRQEIPGSPGVYKFIDEKGNIIYIGKAKNLKKRVASYFSTNKDKDFLKLNKIKRNTYVIEIILTESEILALILEANLIKKYKPKYNIIWKDDKKYIYIKITKEKYPKVLLSRLSSKQDPSLFGPYPSAQTAKRLVSDIRRIFPFCLQKRNVKKACFYSQIGLCSPCPGEIISMPEEKRKNAENQYKNNIKNIKKILNGNFARIKREMTTSMNQLAENEKFEQANEMKNRLNALAGFLTSGLKANDYYDNPYCYTNSLGKTGATLMTLLNSKGIKVKKLTRIECFDISNFQGKESAGSMVVFTNLLKDQKEYRRFRIKIKNSPDDFNMLKETVTRRLKHKNWPKPDLIMLDGGKPQLDAVRKIPGLIQDKIPLIAPSKENEEVVFYNKENIVYLRLAKSDERLKILQQLRDEAHNFALKYHKLLRKKRLLNI